MRCNGRCSGGVGAWLFVTAAATTASTASAVEATAVTSTITSSSGSNSNMGDVRGGGNNNNNNMGNNNGGFIRKSDLPVTGREWVSLHQSVEFLPGNTVDVPDSYWPRLEQQQQQESHPIFGSSARFSRPRSLEDSSATETADEDHEDNSQYRVQPFVEGVSDYDTYQQAWRMLGFMIDCDGSSSNNNNDGGNSGSNDGSSTGEGCQRYVLWAAYVDLEYQGGGIGEYQFWDASTKKWDTTTCDNTSRANKGSSGRCAKMDCHLEDTHWSLLGFFKHKGYDDWMEQLFKHEGICVWSDDEYSFMKNARNAWPQGCMLSGTVTDSGSAIYYDLKPVHGGGITLGLYTDTRCIKEYQSEGKNDPINAENVIGNLLANGGSNDHSGDNNNNNNGGSYSTLSESLQAWDDAFSIWKQCQPCVAYDRNNYGYNVDDDNYRGSSYGTYRYGYDDDYSWNYYYSKKYGGADYDCYDDAGYTNVNQCMKFMAKTTMNTATFRDLSLATAQGTLVDRPLAGYRVASKSRTGAFQTYLFLAASCSVLVYGVYKFLKARTEMSSPDWSPKEPLVFA